MREQRVNTIIEEGMIPSANSLVKYNNPLLIAVKSDKKVEPTTSIKEPELLPDTKQEEKLDTEEILNYILPPIEYEEDNKLWIQKVSTTPARRLDVINLQEQLDIKLQQRQARETGICPIRRELYDQCFDELIRQITINCTERGLLLLRVRDELRMTLDAYQTLYESSTAYGIRKALQAEEGKISMEEQIIKLGLDCKNLEEQIITLRAKLEQTERYAEEQRKVKEKKHAEEIYFLKRANQQLKSQLESIISPRK